MQEIIILTTDSNTENQRILFHRALKKFLDTRLQNYTVQMKIMSKVVVD